VEKTLPQMIKKKTDKLQAREEMRLARIAKYKNDQLLEQREVQRSVKEYYKELKEYHKNKQQK